MRAIFALLEHDNVMEVFMVPKQQELIANARAALAKANNPLGAQVGARSAAMAYDENILRLDKLQNLTGETGSKDGYRFSPAITAYKLSLQAYIATHCDQLSSQEVEALHRASQSLMEDIASTADPKQVKTALGTGLKGEVNWTDFYGNMRHRRGGITPRLQVAINNNISILLNGGTPPVIDMSSQEAALGALQAAPGEASRQVLAFFPSSLTDSSGTDEVVLQTGGCVNHSAMARIWKQGVNAQGHPVDFGTPPHHYRFYRTMCNAGLGCSAADSPLKNELYHLSPQYKWDGPNYLAYTVETREIEPPDGYVVNPTDPQIHQAMYDRLATLIRTERHMLAYKPPTPGPNGEAPDPTTKQIWDGLNSAVPLGPVLPWRSALTKPQKTGNCTVRSILEFLRFELIKQGLPVAQASRIVESHWQFAATHNTSATQQALDDAEARLTQALPKKVTYGLNEHCSVIAIKKLSGTLHTMTVEGPDKTIREIMYDAQSKQGFVYNSGSQSFEQVSDPLSLAVVSSITSHQLNLSLATPRADIAEQSWLTINWTLKGMPHEGRVSAMTSLPNGLFVISGYLFDGGVKGPEREIVYDPLTHKAWWFGADLQKNRTFNAMDLENTSTMGACMVAQFSALAPAYNVHPYDRLFDEITCGNYDTVFSVLSRKPELLGYIKDGQQLVTTPLITLLLQFNRNPAIAAKQMPRLMSVLDHAPYNAFMQKDNGGNTALHRAGWYGQLGVCDKLLKKAKAEGKLNDLLLSRNQHSETALSNVCRTSGDVSAQNKLLQDHFGLSYQVVAYLSKNVPGINWQSIADHPARQDLATALGKMVAENTKEVNKFDQVINMTIQELQAHLNPAPVPQPMPAPLPVKQMFPSVPQINITIQGVSREIPVTDHPCVVSDIPSLGRIGTLNVWCPGSPISPPIAQYLGLKEYRLTDAKVQEAQMKAMAQYIIDHFKQDMTLLALQEIPDPKGMQSGFTILKNELERLAKQANIPLDVDGLEQCYRPTTGTRSGTSLLVNSAKLSIAQVQSVLPYQQGHRGAMYTIHPQSDPDKAFQVLNFHGALDNHAMPQQHKTQLQAAVDANVICLGDANTRTIAEWFTNSNQSVVTASKATVKIDAADVTGNTLDVVIVPPQYLQARKVIQHDTPQPVPKPMPQPVLQPECKKLSPEFAVHWMHQNVLCTGVVNSVTRIGDQYEIAGCLSGSHAPKRAITYDMKTGRATYIASNDPNPKAVTVGIGMAMLDIAPLLCAKAGFDVDVQKLGLACATVLASNEYNKKEMKEVVQFVVVAIQQSTSNTVAEKVAALKTIFDIMQNKGIALRQERNPLLKSLNKAQSYQDAMKSLKDSLLAILDTASTRDPKTAQTVQMILEEHRSRLHVGDAQSLSDSRYTTFQQLKEDLSALKGDDSAGNEPSGNIPH